MQPNYIEIAKLFSNDERFTVPLFQRPYVWTEEEQWRPLWDDILGALRRIEARKGDAPVATHFLGTIVLEQKRTPIGSLTRREVIDGQQRLTTLQILLRAAEHAISNVMPPAGGEGFEAWSMERDKIGRLTRNLSAGEERYKVWPTNEDRTPFRQVMDSRPGDGGGDANTRMAQAYRFFRRQADDYLGSEASFVAVQRLVSALRDHLKLIVLDLDSGDEPQAIFETLNAHGAPLLPADLIKNWLLWEAGRDGGDIERLYTEYWQPFDREHSYWRETVGKGHAARPRVDTFLQNWLTKEVVEPVSPKHIYDCFLTLSTRWPRPSVDNNTVLTESLMKAIRCDAVRFERIDKPQGHSRFDLFLMRLKALGTIVLHPLLLELMARREDADEALDRAGKYLESYLVRRMVCGMQTRSYGELALKLLRAVKKDCRTDPAELIRAELLALTETDAWPTDEEFRHDWVGRRFYGQLRRERVAMILQAIEHYYQSKSGKSEPLIIFDWTQVQIEHIMPRSWEKNWPLPPGLAPEIRNAEIQNIGNLTLVSKALNPTMSNAPWLGDGRKPGKKDHLHKHTIMHCNRQLLDRFPSGWSDLDIKTRAELIFEDALAIWPR